MEELKPCPITMVEIYKGKDPAWKGWHNLIITDNGIPIKLLSPEESKPFLDLIQTWNTRHSEDEK